MTIPKVLASDAFFRIFEFEKMLMMICQRRFGKARFFLPTSIWWQVCVERSVADRPKRRDLNLAGEAKLSCQDDPDDDHDDHDDDDDDDHDKRDLRWW